MKKAAAVFLVLIFIVPCLGVSPIVEFTPFDFQFSSPPVKSVHNVPESIRNVPPHKDDRWGYYSHPGPIRADSGDAPWLMEIRFLKLGLGVDLAENITWRNYGDLSFNFGHFFHAGGDLYRRNYTNAPDTSKRGYGAALTFWTPGYDILIPGLRTELQFKNKGEGSWFFGAGYRLYNFGIITGYDRYDHLSFHDFDELGKIQEISLYLGGRTKSEGRWFGEYRAGVNFNSFDQKGKYPDADIKMNDTSFFFALGGGYKF